MALKLLSNVQETTEITGTGDILLEGAAAGRYAFSAAGMSDGDTTFVETTDGVDAELIFATYNSSPDSFTRTAVIRSTNGGSAVSWSAGTKTVSLVNPGPSDLSAAQLSLYFGALGGTGIKMVRQVFTSSGTYTPTAGMVACLITLTGGGGAGGGSDGASAAGASAGAGGQAGGTARNMMTAAEIGANAAVTIGAGGSAGSNSGGDGGDGGDSVFNPAGTGPTVTSEGGEGGTGRQSTSSVYVGFEVGGSAKGGTTNADTEIRGNPGHHAVTYGSNIYIIAGMGGASFWGGAGAAPVGGTTTGGGDGDKGGGGGGSLNYDSTTGASGGGGGDGYLEIIELVVT